MKIISIVCSFIFTTLLLYPMELPKKIKHIATPRHPKKGKDVSYQQLIQAKDELTDALQTINAKNFENDTDRSSAIKRAYLIYFDTISLIAKTPENGLSSQEKLDCLVGNAQYQYRKVVIKDMIEKNNINPNTISYQGKTPLDDSIELMDVEFTKYLLAHGAQPDLFTTKRGKESVSRNIRNIFS